MMRKLMILVTFAAIVGCETATGPQAEEGKDLSDADRIFQAALAAHGGEAYETANYEFVFREKNYKFKNDGDRYVYETEYGKNDTMFHDYLDNDEFWHKADGVKQELSAKKEAAGRESLNSVIYFATLPHKLKDGSVNKEHLGQIEIKGGEYDVLGVTFQEEGGGEDFQDNYRYWINKETSRIDFLAYDYVVNEGGVRFREAGNPRVVEGILFQDYVNYKAELGTSLDSLPAQWERGELKKLSEINTERVKSLSGGE